MSRLVFLLEEYSMKVLLEGLLPRLYPDMEFICIPHEGKQDLEKSLPRKLRAWREPDVRFVVLRDNDGGDCLRLKVRLTELCADRPREHLRIRIACQELEAWYFGDPDALAEAFVDARLRDLRQKSRFRDPDAIDQPALRLAEEVSSFQKVKGARVMSRLLSPERNTSRSFQVLLQGIEQLAQTLNRPQEG